MSDETAMEEKTESTDTPIGDDPYGSEDFQSFTEADIPAKAESEPEPEEADDKNSRAETDTVDPELIAKAEELGLSQKEIETFKNPEALTSAIKFLEGKLAKADGQSKETVEKNTEDALAMLKSMEDFNTEEYDEKMAKALNLMKSNLVSLVETNQKLLAESQNRQTQEVLGTIDKMFGELGDTYQDLFGKEAPTKYAQGSSERQNINKVLGYYDMIAERASQDGEKLSEKETLERAILVAFPDKIKSITRQELETKVKKRSDMKISRALSSKDKTEMKPGVAKARKSVHDWLKRNGIETDQGFADEDDNDDSRY